MSTSDSYINSLNTRRLRAWEEAKSLLDHAAAQGRDLTAEENQTFARVNREIDDLDLEIRNKLETRQREHEAYALRETNLSAFGHNRLTAREDREDRYLRAWLRGEYMGGLEVDLTQARRERELIRAGASPAEVRALAWDATSGSLVVPTTMARSLYEYLEASVAMFRAPTTKFVTTAGETMLLPTLTTHSIATQVAGQGTALAGSDPVFSRVQLDAFKYGEIAKVSSELIDDAAFDIASFLGRDLGRALGRVIDTDLVVGSGSGKPRGLMTAAAAAGAGSLTTGGSLIAPGYDTLVGAVYGINDSYRSNGAAAWLMKDSTAGTIRKLRDGAGGTIGAPLWEPTVTAGQPDRLLGYPVFVDPNVAAQGSNARCIAFADMSAYYLREVGNPQIEIDRSVYFATDEVAVRAKHRVDGDLVDLNAVTSVVMNV